MSIETKSVSLQEMSDECARLIGGRVVLSSQKQRPMVIKKWKGVSYSVMYLSEGMWRIGKRTRGQETLYNTCTLNDVKSIFEGVVAGKDIPLGIYKIQ